MNYIGSKKSLINFIEKTIMQEINFESNKENYIFADLFAGTGIVGATFKKHNFKIISNDIQYYSYVLNKHLLQTDKKIDPKIIEHLNALEGVEGFIYKNYCLGSGSGRNYFTDYNGEKCDAIRIEIERLKNKKKITEQEYFYLLASLINSIDKYANTASVYGAFLKKIKRTASKKFKLELLPIISGNNKNDVYNKDVNEIITQIKGDILYLDPPYNARQYNSNYHLLETIARYDNPIIKGKTGLRDNDEQKSDFCSKNKVESVFEYLIKNAKFQYVFLSYNNEGLMTLDTIKNIMSKYGEYKIFKKEYKRFKADNDLNRNHTAQKTVEYLSMIKKY